MTDEYKVRCVRDQQQKQLFLFLFMESVEGDRIFADHGLHKQKAGGPGHRQGVIGAHGNEHLVTDAVDIHNHGSGGFGKDQAVEGCNHRRIDPGKPWVTGEGR